MAGILQSWAPTSYDAGYNSIYRVYNPQLPIYNKASYRGYNSIYSW